MCVAINLSGHELPEYQPTMGHRNRKVLLGRVVSFNEVSPFTMQWNVTQLTLSLYQGSWWLLVQD